MKRKPVRPEVETRVVTESRRRCAFCFGLNGDFSEKTGQIAHVERDPSDSSFEKLAWLCFDHHDAYDSQTSQAKGYTPSELIIYRDELYRTIKDGGLLAGSTPAKARSR